MSDQQRMDWLSAQLAYLMVFDSQTGVIYTLPNNGRGWNGDELRLAIDAEIKQQKARTDNFTLEEKE